MDRRRPAIKYHMYNSVAFLEDFEIQFTGLEEITVP